MFFATTSSSCSGPAARRSPDLRRRGSQRDGRVVGDRAPPASVPAAGAPPRHARTARRRAVSVVARAPPDHALDGDDRSLQHGRDAAVGPVRSSASTPVVLPPCSCRAGGDHGSTAMLGFLLRSSVRYRSAWALGSGLEMPVWFISGFIVPLSLLPDWVGRSPGCSPRPGGWRRSGARRGHAVGRYRLAWRWARLRGGRVFFAAVLDSARRHATLALT